PGARDLGVFFFSSRRRHTRFSRDWSSDVCSSDLSGRGEEVTGQRLDRAGEQRGTGGRTRVEAVREDIVGDAAQLRIDDGVVVREIGRAACRERVWAWVAGEQ